MIGICLFGAGRIGSIHGANVVRRGDVKLRYVVDVNAQAGRALADKLGAVYTDQDTALADPQVDAVIIGTATDTHAQLIIAAARAGKAIFCEKPIDLDMQKVDDCLRVVESTGVPFALGFNRRFDPNFKRLHDQINAGVVGNVEMLSITSRDPAPPPLGYIKGSGGLLRDMMIHDFDMARWLLGEELSEVYTMGSCLVDSGIGEQGDIDTAIVLLKTASGKLCQINNSRRACYGYDQRIEVFGAKGMLRAENQTPTQVEFFGEQGVCRDKPLYSFLERYAAAYQYELDDFIEAIAQRRAPLIGGEAGRIALLLADAAMLSLEQGVPVKL